MTNYVPLDEPHDYSLIYTSKGFHFFPLSKIINCYHGEPHSSRGYGKRANKADSPLCKRLGTIDRSELLWSELDGESECLASFARPSVLNHISLESYLKIALSDDFLSEGLPLSVVASYSFMNLFHYLFSDLQSYAVKKW